MDNVFGDLTDITAPQAETLSIQNTGKTAVYTQEIPQTIIEIMQPGIARDDPEYFAAQVMNFVLGSSGFGSRLTEEIREKRGLTYGIYSSFYTLDYLKGISVSTSTKNGNVQDMLTAIKNEFSAMRDNGVTQTELEGAQVTG